MSAPPTAKTLLVRARKLYDDPALPFAESAKNSRDFEGGADWMRSVMAHVRGVAVPAPEAKFLPFGTLKYGLACALSVWVLIFAWRFTAFVAFPVAILAFYAMEVQFLFLFPLVIDGEETPFRESVAWTARAGGTLEAMKVVMPLAAVMLFGGFARQGFVRSWALGCLSVVLWYEDLRAANGRA